MKVIYEDNHIIVVEKPVNVPSQGDKTGDEDMLMNCWRCNGVCQNIQSGF